MGLSSDGEVMGKISLDTRYKGDDPNLKLVDEIQNRFINICIPDIFITPESILLTFNGVRLNCKVLIVNSPACQAHTKLHSDYIEYSKVEHFSCFIGYAGENPIHALDDTNISFDGFTLDKVTHAEFNSELSTLELFYTRNR